MPCPLCIYNGGKVGMNAAQTTERRACTRADLDGGSGSWHGRGRLAASRLEARREASYGAHLRKRAHATTFHIIWCRAWTTLHQRPHLLHHLHPLPCWAASGLGREGRGDTGREPWERRGDAWVEAAALEAWEKIGGTRIIQDGSRMEIGKKNTVKEARYFGWKRCSKPTCYVHVLSKKIKLAMYTCGLSKAVKIRIHVSSWKAHA